MCFTFSRSLPAHKHTVIYDQRITSYHDMLLRTKQLETLYAEFYLFSKKMASRIVEDLARPCHKRQIQPCDEQQGVAGGEKYRVGKVFLKFCTNQQGIYGHGIGGQLNAQKVSFFSLYINSI